jgi:hypothetical protein
MKIVIEEIISWQVCILILVVLLFIIYLFFGGRDDVEFEGLTKLNVGTDAVTGKEHRKSKDQSSEEDENEAEEIIDRTPRLPRDVAGAPMISMSESFEMLASPVIESLPEQEKEIVPCDFEYDEPNHEESSKSIKSPRSLALGNFKCYKNASISKGEALCKQVIEEIYKAPFYCVRPDFLKNPETGRNLELDLYNDFYKVAVERDGQQHYLYPNAFHKTREEFLNQVRRDEYKRKMCDEHGIYLITVPHTVKSDYNDIRKYIEYYLPENYAKRLKENDSK